MKLQLAAILYADVAGYSRLTGLNEKETHAKLNEGLNLLVDTLSTHGGHKVHEAGDAILAEFQSVTEAITAAVEFQNRMAEGNEQLPEAERLQFRVGVNLGEVMHDRDDIYGDGVNLAARIQELADPGGICVSATVYEQVYGKVDQVFDDLGHRKVKNIARPIHVYRVRLSTESAGAKRRKGFFIERDEIDRTSLTTGRCMCGEVSYEIYQPAIDTAVCHCRMCQRSNSAPFVAWAIFPLEAVRFTNSQPKYYKSSPIAERGFCANCGSGLTMWYYVPEPSDVLGILVASLDHPEGFAPAAHWGVESQMHWVDMHDDLPRVRLVDSSALRRRWEAAGVPDSADWK